MRWIIGDVHGMRAPLMRLLDEVARIDSAPRFYFVGDYVNRGRDARGVIDLLLTLKDAKFVRGNHDDIFDQVVNDASYAGNASNGDRIVAFQWFMDFGLDHTLISYGVDLAQLERCASRPSPERLDAIVAAVPDNHRRFFRELPPIVEEDDLFIAHAKWDPDEPDSAANFSVNLKTDDALRHRLLWGRFTEDEIPRPKAWRRTGYFGHTPVSFYAASQRTGEVQMLPLAGPRLRMIDTGAALSPEGRLTAFCADNNTFVQVDPQAQPIVTP
jgi:hypothetical protein